MIYKTRREEEGAMSSYQEGRFEYGGGEQWRYSTKGKRMPEGWKEGVRGGGASKGRVEGRRVV